ncbi:MULTISPECIES: hypothetical protein [unclassified Frankia]|nr:MULTISPECIES: hypothetical protein [unclassified Frankia]MBL7622239.1 hypothetical protein [Frankia sp. AgB1.8]
MGCRAAFWATSEGMALDALAAADGTPDHVVDSIADLPALLAAGWSER